MTDDQILDMLSEIIEEVDYDIWKDLFLYGEEGDMSHYVDIVRKHLG